MAQSLSSSSRGSVSAASSAGASVLGASLTLTGRVAGDGDLELRGRLEGEVDLRGELTVAEGAVARANVAATRVVVRGVLVGDARATDSIALEPTARVVGDLTAPRITIALGAQIRGNLDMGGDAADVPAPRAVARAAPVARPAVAAPVATPARPMAQKGPLTPAKPVAVTRKSTPAAKGNAEPVKAEAAPPEAPQRKEPPAPVVPMIKKGQKGQAKKRSHGGESK